MKVLITGSGGLVGRVLAKRLISRGHEVVPFDLKADAQAPARDIRDAKALADALTDCDGVFHLAAVSRVAWGEEDPDTCRAINVTATQVLMDSMHAARVAWIVFASSREVYGQTPIGCVTEAANIAPFNVYGRSKADGEALIANAEPGAPRAAIVRLSNVYGTIHDHPDRAVPSILWRALNHEPISLTGANSYFDFVHVNDSVEGLMLAGELIARTAGPLPPVHLATGVATSLHELARLAVDLCASTSKVTIIPAREYDVGGFCGDPTLAAEIYGWRPQVTLMNGLAHLRQDLIESSMPIAPAFRPQALPGLYVA
jgi:nucleoside-diphosphate-sugar epimerase